MTKHDYYSHHHFVAMSNGIIFGLGDSDHEARMDAGVWHEVNSDGETVEPEFTVTRCSPLVAEYVAERGHSEYDRTVSIQDGVCYFDDELMGLDA